MKRIILGAIATLLFLSSCKDRNAVAKAKDYDRFLQTGLVQKEADAVKQEILFWENRLAADTGSFVNMAEIASYELKLFKLTGQIEHLKRGDSLLKASSAKLNNTRPELLYSISQTCVTQHQFINAAAHIAEAEKAKGDMYTIRLLQFDALMELGKYGEAYKSLESLRDKQSFDYLVRKAKWEDHKGDLDKAIILMETAAEKVKGKNAALQNWALSNLSDMYGHAGRVEEAYKGYIRVLEKDPANLYCLKGIAWIAYSHDNNTAEAKRILQYILTQTNMPDLKLMLAEIAESEGNEAEKQKWVNEFIDTVTKPVYGDMYNKYLIDIYTEETGEYAKAYAIAERELKNRLTPETCDWMAWVQYKMGDKEKAKAMTEEYVHQKTFEPGALMHTAFIYADNGKKDQARKLLEECLQSSFELGPLAVKQVKEKLAAL